MKEKKISGVINELQPGSLARMLSAYAGADVERHRLLWLLDSRFAHTVSATSEPMIAQIRLAWWSEALTDESEMQGRGEPLVDALRSRGWLPMPGLSQWLDGWEAVIGETDLRAYGEGRGGGLFKALAGEAEPPPWLTQAGAAWALWDLSGHISDRTLADQAIALARDHLIERDHRWPGKWRPMRIAYQLARHDILKGRHAPSELTPRLYLRLLRAALTRR